MQHLQTQFTKRNIIMKTKSILTVILIAAIFSFVILFNDTAQSGPAAGTHDPGGDITPTPTRPVKPVKLTGALSDLKVEQVWLDDACQINFRLKNTGKYPMPDKAHKGGMVRVKFGRNHEDFNLNKPSAKMHPLIDPNGALKKPGSSLSYKTNIVLGDQLQVKAYVGKINRLTLAAKQKGKFLTLSPQCNTKQKVEKVKKPAAGVVKKPDDVLPTGTDPGPGDSPEPEEGATLQEYEPNYPATECAVGFVKENMPDQANLHYVCRLPADPPCEEDYQFMSGHMSSDYSGKWFEYRCQQNLGSFGGPEPCPQSWQYENLTAWNQYKCKSNKFTCKPGYKVSGLPDSAAPPVFRYRCVSE
jgi:hypothetical protein